MTTNPAPSSKSLRDWFGFIILVLSFAKMIFDLFNNSPLYIFLIALIIFVVSVVYSLYRLYITAQYKALWIRTVIIFIMSIVIAVGGSWYYFTQYQPDGTPIESFDTQVIPYEGGLDGASEPSWADLSFFTTPSMSHLVLSYQVDFGIPMQGEGWAGFYIDFKQPIDLRKYQAIQFQIQYGCNEDKIQLILKDDSRNEFGVLLDQNYLKGNYTDKQSISIPLEKFSDVSLDHVKNITFHADSKFVRGEHWALISDVHFVK